MSNNLFEISPFNLSNFLKCLENDNQLLEPNTVKSKRQTDYLYNYLKSSELDCQTIVIEYEYVDVDFLDDYVEYFAKCFYPYNRFCKRLHFFSNQFSESEYQDILEKKISDEDLKNGYLGYIVIKPIPYNIYGRTCLKNYNVGETRYFPASRQYNVHLHGINLTINSLAFQEQDNVVGACATTALWSCLHGVNDKFHLHIPTPIKITQFAFENTEMDSRGMPNHEGLTLAQMIRATNKVGLEAEVYKVKESIDFFKLAIYSYLSFKIPIVLLVNLVEQKQEANGIIEVKSKGLHALTVSGYNLNDSSIPFSEDFSMNLTAMRIDKIYLHDDQVGPFARSEFVSKPFIGKGINAKYALKAPWWDKLGVESEHYYIIESILIPIYHKIRMNLNEVIYIVRLRLNRMKSDILKMSDNHADNIDKLKSIYFDITLQTVVNFKEFIYNEKQINKETKLKCLSMNYPKYLWIVKIMITKQIKTIMVFDATDTFAKRSVNCLIQNIEY